MANQLRFAFRSIARSAIGAALLLALVSASHIPAARAQARPSIADKINANTVMVLTAGSGLTYGAFASDLATVLNDGDNMRILPVQGHSAFLNVRYLRGIDMGFIQSNVLGHYRRKGLVPDLTEKIVYL